MSPAASGADVSKTTALPSPDSAPGRSDEELAACPPPAATLARTVDPVTRSCTNTSAASLLSPGTRLVADEVKTTKRPSALIRAFDDAPSAAPPAAAETSVVAPVARSRTYTSLSWLVSAGTSAAAVPNVARLPSAEREMPSWAVVSFSGGPAGETVTSAGGAAASALPDVDATS